MPYTEGTLTDEDVADELGIPVDSRVTIATDTARAWGEAKVPSATPSALWSDPPRWRGGVLEACFQYQRRATVGGFPGYEDAPTMEIWTLHLEAIRLLRPDPVVA